MAAQLASHPGLAAARPGQWLQLCRVVRPQFVRHRVAAAAASAASAARAEAKHQCQAVPLVSEPPPSAQVPVTDAGPDRTTPHPVVPAADLLSALVPPASASASASAVSDPDPPPFRPAAPSSAHPSLAAPSSAHPSLAAPSAAIAPCAAALRRLAAAAPAAEAAPRLALHPGQAGVVGGWLELGCRWCGVATEGVVVMERGDTVGGIRSGGPGGREGVVGRGGVGEGLTGSRLPRIVGQRNGSGKR